MWIVIVIVVVFLLAFFVRKHWNNYVLIARNFTYIYEIMREEYKERFPDEDMLLMACGIVDALAYTFSVEDMKGILSRAKTSECFASNLQHSPINKRAVYLRLSYSGNLLLNFVMQLEIMIFLNDTSFNRIDILTSVVSKTEMIGKAIDRAKRSYESGKRPALLHRAVSNFMSSVAFEEVRDQIGIIHPETGKPSVSRMVCL